LVTPTPTNGPVAPPDVQGRQQLVELSTFVRTLMRRWYIVVPTFVVFAALAFLLSGHVKTTYEASGNVVFLRQGQPADPKDGPINPFQTLDYQSLQMANVMATVATDPTFRDAYVDAGGTPNYTVLASATQTPVLALSTTANSQDEALASYHLLTDRLRSELERRQADVGAPKETWVSAPDLSVPVKADPQTGNKSKALILVLGMGIVVAFGLAFLADSIAAARRRDEQDSGHDAPTHDDARAAGPAPVPSPRVQPAVTWAPVVEPDPETEPAAAPADHFVTRAQSMFARTSEEPAAPVAPSTPKAAATDEVLDLDQAADDDGGDLDLDELVNGALAEPDDSAWEGDEMDAWRSSRRRRTRSVERYSTREASGQ